jgi:hypothetical protein
MLIALSVIGVIALIAIGYVIWGAILVGREYNAAERLDAAQGHLSELPASAPEAVPYVRRRPRFQQIIVPVVMNGRGIAPRVVLNSVADILRKPSVIRPPLRTRHN